MAFVITTYRWFVRYKIYHLPFWFVYHLMWWTITIGSASTVIGLIFFTHSAIKFSFYLIFQAIGAYFNLYFLIPKYLEKGKYVLYISLFLLTIALTAAFVTTGYYVSAWITGQPFQELWGIEPTDFFHFYNINALPSTVAVMTLAMSIKLTKNWIQSKRRERILEKEKLETELKFLKSQFNPHFLFNTINSIFVLIHKNPDMASEALSKFSDLLRYQLYECNEHEIPIGQEISYLENFIELETLRHDLENLKLSIDLENKFNPDLSISPFILIPFVENAFKHVTKQKGQNNWIKIKLEFDEDHLRFEVANSVNAGMEKSREFIDYSGLGLKNVKRRLDLIYTSEHDLLIEESKDQFHIILSLNLHRQKFPVREPAQLET